MTSVNLIPAPRRERLEARRRRGRWVRFLRAYAIVLAVVCALAMLPAHAAAPSLESSIARLDRRIEATTKSLDESHRQLIALSKQLELARAIGDHPDWSNLLSALAHARADDAVLESFDLSMIKIDEKPAKSAGAKPDANAKPVQHDYVVVKIAGLCPSPAACFQFARAVERLDFFERVTVKDTRSQALGTMPATHFEIEAVVAAAPAQAPAPTGAVPPVASVPRPSPAPKPAGGAK